MASLGDNVRLCLKRKKSLVFVKIGFEAWFMDRIGSSQPVLEEGVDSK